MYGDMRGYGADARQSLGLQSLNLPPNQSRVIHASRETRFQIISGRQSGAAAPLR
jgi:hypothetical protein